MLKQIAGLAAALALAGCGIPEYFDQHHANVREASTDNSDNVTTPRNAPVVQTPLPTVVRLQAPAPVVPAPIVAVAPARPPATTRQQSPSSVGPPPNAYVAPPRSAIATTEEAPTAVASPPIAAPAPAQPSAPAPQGETATAVLPMDVPVATAPVPAAAPQEVATPAPSAHEAPPEQPSAAAPQESYPPSTSSAPPSIHAYCETLAVQRAADAAANGYDDDTQQAVHDGSYKKCVIWESAHGGPN